VPPKAEIEAMTVIALGRFNPQIFHPAWFAANNLLSEEEAAQASVEVVAAQVADFDAGWFNCHVAMDQFLVSSPVREQWEPLRDLVLGTFELLSHTPLRFVIISAEFHSALDSEERLHALGHALSPKALWEGFLTNPGMRSMTMQGDRTDGRLGSLSVTVEPSLRVRNAVYVRVNDQFDLLDPKTLSSGDGGEEEEEDLFRLNTFANNGAETLVRTVREAWAASVSFAEQAMTDILRFE
jgi:hypothetical protein